MDQERSGGRLVVGIEHAQCHLRGRARREKDVDIVAETQVLRALPDVEAQLALALAGIAGIKLQDAVLHLQAGQSLAHRLFVEHLQIEPAPAHQPLGRARQFTGVRTLDDQHRGDARLVLHLHQERSPALFHQLRFGRAFLHFDAAFRIDIDAHQAMAVENLLDLLHGFGAAEIRALGRGQRLTGHLERIGDALHLRGERLQFYVADDRQLFRQQSGSKQRKAQNTHRTLPKTPETDGTFPGFHFPYSSRLLILIL